MTATLLGPFTPRAGYKTSREAVIAAGVTAAIEFRESGRVVVAEVRSDPDARGLFSIAPWGCPAELVRLSDVRAARVIEGYSQRDRAEAIRRQRARGRLDVGEQWPRPAPAEQSSGAIGAGGLLEAVQRAADRLGVPSARRSSRNQRKLDE